MTTTPLLHPVLAYTASMRTALETVDEVEPMFMGTADKATALVELAAVEAQLVSLRLRVTAVAEDVAERDGSRDVASWTAHQCRVDRGVARTDQALATALEVRWQQVGVALAEGRVNPGPRPTTSPPGAGTERPPSTAASCSARTITTAPTTRPTPPTG